MVYCKCWQERSEENMIVYDNRFNGNEWFIIAGLIVGISIMYFLPKRFPKKISIVFFMCGVFSGFFFDHSLSVEPVDYYDVNDKSTYQIMDFLSYVSYGPISYFFFYFYDRLKPSSSLLYILIWSFISVGLEWCAEKVGVFHYKHGYQLYYSFPIYLLVNSCWTLLYYRYHGTVANSNRDSVL